MANEAFPDLCVTCSVVGLVSNAALAPTIQQYPLGILNTPLSMSKQSNTCFIATAVFRDFCNSVREKQMLT